MNTVYYTLATTALGDVGVVWRQKNNTPAVVKIFLPREGERVDDTVLRHFPGFSIRSHDNVKEVCDCLREYLAGNVTVFSLHMLDMSICAEFQSHVLNETWLIPRVWSVHTKDWRKEWEYRGAPER